MSRLLTDFPHPQSIEVDGRRFKLSIWDTAGQERFRTLTSSYYRGAQGVVIGESPMRCIRNELPILILLSLCEPRTVYDVTSRESFNALPTWFNELETFTNNPEIVKIIVGNKVDKESTRIVTTDEGKAFADKQGCLFVECSAKKGQKVKDAFDELVHQVSSRR